MEKDANQEVAELISAKKQEDLEADRKLAFHNEYLELCKKHGYTHAIQPPKIIKVDFYQTQ